MPDQIYDYLPTYPLPPANAIDWNILRFSCNAFNEVWRKGGFIAVLGDYVPGDDLIGPTEYPHNMLIVSPENGTLYRVVEDHWTPTTWHQDVLDGKLQCVAGASNVVHMQYTDNFVFYAGDLIHDGNQLYFATQPFVADFQQWPTVQTAEHAGLVIAVGTQWDAINGPIGDGLTWLPTLWSPALVPTPSDPYTRQLSIDHKQYVRITPHADDDQQSPEAQDLMFIGVNTVQDLIDWSAKVNNSLLTVPEVTINFYSTAYPSAPTSATSILSGGSNGAGERLRRIIISGAGNGGALFPGFAAWELKTNVPVYLNNINVTQLHIDAPIIIVGNNTGGMLNVGESHPKIILTGTSSVTFAGNALDSGSFRIKGTTAPTAGLSLVTASATTGDNGANPGTVTVMDSRWDVIDTRTMGDLDRSVAWDKVNYLGGLQRATLGGRKLLQLDEEWLKQWTRDNVFVNVGKNLGTVLHAFDVSVDDPDGNPIHSLHKTDIDIDAPGTGYQLGEVVYFDAGPLKTYTSGWLIINGLDGVGGVGDIEVVNQGMFRHDVDIADFVFHWEATSGTGGNLRAISFNALTGSTLPDLGTIQEDPHTPGVHIGDFATVLVDEQLSSAPGVAPKRVKSRIWMVLDTNGDGVANWVPTEASDTLLGRTETELYQDITYNEIKSLISGDGLEPGMKYCITDFINLYEIHNPSSNSWEIQTTASVEPLVVTAASVNTLEATASSRNRPQDVIYYTVNNGKNGTSDSIGSKGTILRRIDTQSGSDFPWDFVSCKQYRGEIYVDQFINNFVSNWNGSQVTASQIGSLWRDQNLNGISYGSIYMKYQNYNEGLTPAIAERDRRLMFLIDSNLLGALNGAMLIPGDLLTIMNENSFASISLISRSYALVNMAGFNGTTFTGNIVVDRERETIDAIGMQNRLPDVTLSGYIKNLKVSLSGVPHVSIYCLDPVGGEGVIHVKNTKGIIHIGGLVDIRVNSDSSLFSVVDGRLRYSSTLSHKASVIIVRAGATVNAVNGHILAGAGSTVTTVERGTLSSNVLCASACEITAANSLVRARGQSRVKAIESTCICDVQCDIVLDSSSAITVGYRFDIKNNIKPLIMLRGNQMNGNADNITRSLVYHGSDYGIFFSEGDSDVEIRDITVDSSRIIREVSTETSSITVGSGDLLIGKVLGRAVTGARVPLLANPISTTWVAAQGGGLINTITGDYESSSKGAKGKRMWITHPNISSQVIEWYANGATMTTRLLNQNI